MKIAHVVLVTPGKCGLYETTRELVAAERALGADARMYDPAPTKFHPEGDEDRGAVIVRDKGWLSEADVIIDHSGCDGSTDKLQTPHIFVAHGRPKHSFIGELQGGTPCYAYRYRLAREDKYKAAVTFWPEHVGHLQFMFRSKPVHHIPACVDLKAWSNQGPSGYKFHDHRGTYNIVLSDAWRDDGDAFDALNGAALAARMLPGAKVHIYGKQGENSKAWPAIFKTMQDDGTLGESAGWVKGLDNVYRAADLVVTPHTIATRAVREAKACGCPVYVATAGQGADHDAAAIVAMLKTPPSRAAVRAEAERDYSPLNTAKAMLSICERAKE